MSSTFSETISKSILILDGAMGTMIQRRIPDSSSYKGVGEYLNIVNPEVILGIHKDYIEAGADIIETNSFGANRLTQKAHGLSAMAREMAFRAAVIAREAADSADRKVWVAGSVGPGGITLSIGSDADDPAYREYGFNDLKDAYKEQIGALIEGGVDLILMETWFDALNAKAAIKAFTELGAVVPLVISATVSDRSGRMLTGQTLEAFASSVMHAPGLAAFGINCALGAAQMQALVHEICRFSALPLIFFPNAGMPDEMGSYGDSPETMAEWTGKMADEGLLNIVGGCCGTGPEHIRAIAESVAGKAPRIPQAPVDCLQVSGLENYRIDRRVSFTNIGERTNVAGSRKFARLISEGNYEEALRIAAAQIEGGADIIDVNMDDAMLDSAQEMTRFLRYIASDPNVAKAAIMIDSSDWNTICAGLENVQGKAIVNSISLKEGEETFVRKARHIAEMGAAMVVMAFDEEGQATSYSRKVEIAERSYRLLVESGIRPSDIIFDVNVLSIGTGIAEHSRFGVDFIDAVAWIKNNLKGTLCSGGVSNLSFAFRGNNAVREAMHSAFLYHAMAAGMDMAIVNPQMLQVYDSIDPELLKAVEDVIFDRNPEATTTLVELASALKNGADTQVDTKGNISDKDCEERLIDALVKGGSASLETDVSECLERYGTAVSVIEGPLMRGMEKVGSYFAEGKMFLPQVVRSAKVMRDAVNLLEPYMKESGENTDKPKVVIATVRGDVHDIGKNITAIVLRCSGFDVIDLGVMVASEDIVDAAVREGAEIIGLSGLITPSLYRMEEVCSMLSDKGLDIAVFVGGAAASAVHTAVKLSGIYGNVHYGQDASATAVKCKKYISSRVSFLNEEKEEQERLRTLHAARNREKYEARTLRDTFDVGIMHDIEHKHIDISELKPYFDWRMFKAVSGMAAAADDDCRYIEMRTQAETLMPGFDVELQASFLDCRRNDEDCIISRDETLVFPMLRQKGGASLCDFLPSDSYRQMGVFAASVKDKEPVCGCGKCPADILRRSVAVCLAEAASSWANERFTEESNCRVIMPGAGYSCFPDHGMKREMLALLDLDITLTESCAMIPEASVCTLVFAHPDAYFPVIECVDRRVLERYCRLRGYNEVERKLFTGIIVSD